MKLVVLQVFDSKAQCYLKPMFCITREVGIRMFAAAARDSQTEWFHFPEDFTLFETGSWDDSTGRMVELEAFVPIGTALQLRGPLAPLPERVVTSGGAGSNASGASEDPRQTDLTKFTRVPGFPTPGNGQAAKE